MAIKRTKFSVDGDYTSPLVDVNVTAREYAKDVVFSALEITGYWEERRPDDYKGMTDGERASVNFQIGKIVDRLIGIINIKVM